MATLRAHDGLLILETMYYADEIRQPESVERTQQQKKSARKRDKKAS